MSASWGVRTASCARQHEAAVDGAAVQRIAVIQVVGRTEKGERCGGWHRDTRANTAAAWSTRTATTTSSYKRHVGGRPHRAHDHVFMIEKPHPTLFIAFTEVP